MKCGVRFCGGCNPRYDRGIALKKLREHFSGKIEFPIAEEGSVYDALLVIGGCSSCCASYEQFQTTGPVFKIWDQAHMDTVISKIEDFLLRRK